MEDERLLRPPIALAGLKNRDEASVRQWLSNWVLQAEDQQQAKERLNNLLHFHLASALKYPDETAVHFAAHHVVDMEKDPRANTGYDELVAMASEIITNHYDARTAEERSFGETTE